MRDVRVGSPTLGTALSRFWRRRAKPGARVLHGMHRSIPLLLVILTSGAVALSGCGGDADADKPVVRRDGQILAITTPPDGASTRLGWLDRDTLMPRGAGFDLGEYHDAWSFSPDGGTVAVGTFARTGVRLVNVTTLRLIRDIPMPIAAMGVGWLTGDRIAVLLQRGGIIVIDVRDGRVLRRWPLSYRVPCTARRQASTRHGVVFVVTAAGGDVTLMRIDRQGELRLVELRAVRSVSSSHTCASAGFAVDPAGQRALVLAARGPIADVDLRTLRVTYQDSRQLRRLRGVSARCRAAGRACTSRRSVEWAAPDTVVIAGADRIDRRGARPSQTPAGVGVVNTRTWSTRRIDRMASDAASTADGVVLAFGGRRPGVRATGLDGAQRWTALRGTLIRAAVVAGNRVYVLDDPPRMTHVLDAATGTVVSSRPTALGRLDVLTGRDDAGDGVS